MEFNIGDRVSLMTLEELGHAERYALADWYSFYLGRVDMEASYAYLANRVESFIVVETSTNNARLKWDEYEVSFWIPKELFISKNKLVERRRP